MKKFWKIGLIALGMFAVIGCSGVTEEQASNKQTDTQAIVMNDVKPVAADDESNVHTEEAKTEAGNSDKPGETKTEAGNSDKPEETKSEETDGVVLQSEETNTAEIKAEEPEPAYTVTDVTMLLYAASKVNVRSGPDKNEAKLGTLSTNEEVNVTGEVGNGWYRIQYNGGEGYVKASLLSAEKQTVSAPDINNGNTGDGSTGTGNSGNSGNGNDSGMGSSTGNGSNNNTGSNAGNDTGNGGSEVTVPITEDTQGNLVWVPTKGGTKYHNKSTCSGMKDPKQVTVERAVANGYTPCKKCYK